MPDGIVLSCTGGRYGVYVDGHRLEAVLRGRMKHRSDETVLVGDRVVLALHGPEAATIEGIHPRRTLLRRRSPGRARGVRALAANIDQVVVVGAARMPDWDPALMDRFTAVAEANDLPIVIVVNKADLDASATAHGVPYRQAGYPVIVTSATAGTGLGALRRQLAGAVSLFTGPTGVGKSTLLNALVPGLTLRTAVVSRRSHAGRHTTVAAEMHPLGDEGFVVDTPGLRDIGLWGLDPLEVGAAFPEFASRRDGCRFDNCRHRDEPSCAVRAAVDRGDIAGTRYTSYRRLLDEAEAAARPWT
ncbi:MAG: ribosome small subunit-dependent GTPase A [Gemmatimonadota bacterium]|nr:ribosome small subunit-dependent GTPase A [Gemmatimonadota bacterium]